MGRRPEVLYLTEEERSFLELQTKARTIQAQIKPYTLKYDENGNMIR